MGKEVCSDSNVSDAHVPAVTERIAFVCRESGHDRACPLNQLDVPADCVCRLRVLWWGWGGILQEGRRRLILASRPILDLKRS